MNRIAPPRSASATRPITRLIPGARLRPALAAIAALLALGTALPAAAEPDATARAAIETSTRERVAPLPKKLLDLLQTTIAEHGAAEAVSACSEKAPAAARKASEDTGWQIRRVSQRNRNPGGVPDAWEAKALADFDTAVAAGADPATLERSEFVTEGGRTVFRYAKALATQPMCVTCHGAPDGIPSDVRARIASVYPDDRATGFAPGQIRGALVVKRVVE
ncbi:Tll0287-like domain-containing protein [Derxia gummosa]|uniref:Tll0287-like domain-containing protein n=1 Tax=Derxia gummosa DSM 723 TaxID=1121388 RepID=A0A8B6XAA9_9BURK|nr:DUF3365 domain-containing protein [Derxia gummosa]